MSIRYASPQLAERIAILMDDPEAVFDREIIDHRLISLFHRSSELEEPAKMVECTTLMGTLASILQADSCYALPDKKETGAPDGDVGDIGVPERSDLEGLARVGADSTAIDNCQDEWSAA